MLRKTFPKIKKNFCFIIIVMLFDRKKKEDKKLSQKEWNKQMH